MNEIAVSAPHAGAFFTCCSDHSVLNETQQLVSSHSHRHQYGTNDFSCRKSTGHLNRHNAIGVLIRHALLTAEIPYCLQPVKLSHTNDMRPWCHYVMGDDYALVMCKMRSVGLYVSEYTPIQYSKYDILYTYTIISFWKMFSLY